MKMHLEWDFYVLKPEITGKQQSKIFQITEDQKSTEYQNISKMEDQLSHLACQGENSHPCTPVSRTTVVDLCCILSL